MSFGRKAFFFLSLVLILSGCANTQKEYASDNEALTDRAQKYWGYVVAKDYEKAYSFLSPAYRERFNYLSHMLSRPPRVEYTTAKVLNIVCESESSCTVEIDQIHNGIKGLKVTVDTPIKQVFPDKWIKLDGVWWRYLR